MQYRGCMSVVLEVLDPVTGSTDLGCVFPWLQVVKAICWVPNRRGVVAAACTDPSSQTQRLATMGRLSPAHILIWNFRDPVHPE